MESIIRAAMPIFQKLLEFLEAQASESSSSSPTGIIYLTTVNVEENNIVLTAEEWGHFMSLLMTCRRNLENSCGIYVDRRHLNTREVTYQKNSTRQNLINWLREILPASDPIQGTLPVSNALEDIVAREPRKRSAPRRYADSQHRDSEIVAFQRNVRRNRVSGKCH